jgi:hypothetical protein
MADPRGNGLISHVVLELLEVLVLLSQLLLELQKLLYQGKSAGQAPHAGERYGPWDYD